jgi:membrane protein DedA with SNARE-associated domain
VLVFWGRLVPGVRTLVSVPAGIERMSQGPFLAWTTAGSLIWTLLLTLAGQALGQGYERVQGWLAPWAQGIERGLLVALAAGVVIWTARLVWQRNHQA